MMAIEHPTATTLGARARRAAWALLVLVALAQVAIAAHWYAHDAATLADHCAICLQLDRLDQAIADDTSYHPLAAASIMEPVVDNRGHPATILRNYNPRAPPILRT